MAAAPMMLMTTTPWWASAQTPALIRPVLL